MVRSELKYLIGTQIVNLKCRVFRVVRAVATVRFRVEPDTEPTREFGPVANTSDCGNTEAMATLP
jgi:hypothetical protein